MGTFSKRYGIFREIIGSPSGVGTSLMPVFITGIILMLVVIIAIPTFSIHAVSLIFFFAPVWMPMLLTVAALRTWIVYKQSSFIASQKYVLLEIKPPRTHAKTPLAMEVVLSGLHIKPGESTWYARLIQGKVRPWWSLEIAVIDGQVRFFIWTREALRRNIESNFYAQYPGVQIFEVPDYARLISAKPEEWDIWGCDFEQTKPDPYPIKTYIDYGLDKPAKEYEQTDPLANLLEFLGTFGPGEQVWLQIPIQVHTGEKKYHRKKNATGGQYTWRDEATKIIQEIRAKTVGKIRYKDIFTGEMRETDGFPNPTKGESETMAAIEHNVAKLAFDVGARVVYLAGPGHFSATAIPGIIGLFRQFSSEGFNGFKPTRWLAPFNDYPWEPFAKTRKNKARRFLVDAYRRRQYFHEPYELPPMVMSIEEIATLYHIPSATVETPNMTRVTSVTGTAPSNLPT